jgi:hypothetical protein
MPDAHKYVSTLAFQERNAGMVSAEQKRIPKKGDERARPCIMLRALKSEAKRIFRAVSGISL